MLYHLIIENIGDHHRTRNVNNPFAILFLQGMPRRAWVARVKYIRGNYIDREFVQGQSDYTKSNSIGSRGIYIHYFLDEGLYEISSPQSWKNIDRYFAYVENGELWRVSKEEAKLWLDQQSGILE